VIVVFGRKMAIVEMFAVDVFPVFGRSESDSSFCRFLFDGTNSADNVSLFTTCVSAVVLVLSVYLILYLNTALNPC